MKIGILGNCQAFAWREALQVLLPEAVVWSIDLADRSQGDPLERASTEIAETERLLVVDFFAAEAMESTWVKESVYQPPVRIPSLTFSAFHPDIIFATCAGATVTSAQGAAWNSQIALWCYLNEVPEDDCIEMFSDDVFEEVGYLDQFPVSLENCRQQLGALGLSADDWVGACLEGGGVFMHGSNHPTAAAIGCLATQVFGNLIGGRTARTMSYQEWQRYLTDRQRVSVWPVLAPVAARLGVDASDLFKHHGNYLRLPQFIHESYRQWRLANLHAANVQPIPKFSAPVEDALSMRFRA